MTDPLSIPAGTAGLLSLGIQVTESLFKYYTLYKSQDTDVARITERLENLLTILRSLDASLRNRPSQPDEDDLVQTTYRSVQNCDEIIRELQEESEKFSNAVSPSGIRSAIKASSRRAAYPFRQSTLQKLEEDVGEIQHNLSMALDVLHLRGQKVINDDITELKELLERISAGQVSLAIRDWLNAPDATINYNTICRNRHAGTGMWFIKGHYFKTWLTRDNSFLWLNGFAGCGKSFLCSTAIQHALRQRQHKLTIGIAFFYFIFNDETKQDDSAMIRALLLQLAGQLQDCQKDLARLHNLYQPGTPPVEVLIEYLRYMIRRFQHVYILLDALDESPRYSKREGVLAILERIRKWCLPGLHLLVTSRDEPDIRESLSPAFDEDVTLRNDEVNKDISNFVSFQLKTNPSFQKWQEYHDEIQQTLTERAQGVFRYIECQFGALKRCPRTKSHLNECLQSLPRSLDETYERILCNIDESCIDDARRILTLLCFSSRPLTVAELVDGYAVNLNEPPYLDSECRLLDIDSLSEICLGLIIIEEDNRAKGRARLTVRIAHFSVQEYLESDRIRQQKAAIYALQSKTSHALIVQICLVYLLEPGLSSSELGETTLEEFPLAYYAAEFWYHHYENSKSLRSQFESLVLRLFKEQKESFYTWITLHNMDEPWRGYRWSERGSSKAASPIYFASLLGLDWLLHDLLTSSLESGTDTKDLIHSHGGRYGNALQAASSNSHEKVVQMLLDKGANVNAQDGFYGNALQAASSRGYEKIVQMLLEKSADVNAQGGYYGNALQAASSNSHEKVVQMLLDKGANVNAQGGENGNALQAALYNGHQKVVQMLLEKGADMNTQGGMFVVHSR
ncbi:Ankyrin repeat protein [Aspergillus sclerotialis]|uniref:Ankyrin repeat protein n=1 Tax=Aspergillus sclerotialis TaxID=2070753 RepID=A0A3A2ZJL4_9EURO|nr:Ankyrin repeat protein [Aspergillus sclerotialis]